MVGNHVILAMLWVAYCIVHSVLASEWIKKKLRSRMKNYKWFRLWYTLLAFVSLFAVIYYQVTIATIELFHSSNLFLIAGIIISGSGLILMLVCIRKYFMSLSGLRSLFFENFSNELQIKGIHRYVRHPLYLGTFVFIWGLLLLFPYLSLLIATSIITVYTLIGIELEEQKLILEFGDDYRQYQKKVPKLIPSFKFRREQ